MGTIRRLNPNKTLFMATLPYHPIQSHSVKTASVDRKSNYYVYRFQLALSRQAFRFRFPMTEISERFNLQPPINLPRRA